MVNAECVEYTEDDHEEQLNELFGTVNVCGMEMDSGRILREVDPIAFRCSMCDAEGDKWVCDECGTEFDNEDDANECCCEVE